jgi:tRNA A37 N6-isopentenylltransferase MiaA
VNKKLYWNQSVYRDREFMANRPDIIIKQQKEERYKLIDVVTPAERNVTQKETEKKKYKSLHVGIQGMCTMLIGASGIVIKCLKKNLKDVPEKKH